MARAANPHPVHVTITRWLGPDGRRCLPNAPGGRKVTTKSESYYAYVRRSDARTCVALGTTDLGQAWVALRALLKELADENAGITDPYSRAAARPIEEHVAAWLAALADEGMDRERVAMLGARLRRLIAEAGWQRLTDVTPTGCAAALGRLRRDTTGPAGEVEARGISAQTRNHYLSHAKQFVRWCVGDRRLRENTLTQLDPVDVAADLRHARRSPTDAEVQQLFAHLASDPTVRLGMSGPRRRLGYSLAMATGLRAGELRSLTRESFDLEAGSVLLQAAYDKRRRQVSLPLPAWLTLELRTWFEAGGGLWDPFPDRHPGRLLKADLAAAGVPYSVQGPDGPLFFDFHALRHWYCTQVASQPGMDLRTLLALTRHSTAELALRRYAKPMQDRVRAAADLVPAPPVSETHPG